MSFSLYNTISFIIPSPVYIKWELFFLQLFDNKSYFVDVATHNCLINISAKVVLTRTLRAHLELYFDILIITVPHVVTELWSWESIFVSEFPRLNLEFRNLYENI